MIAAGLALAGASSLFAGACEAKLAWNCSGIQGKCTCIVSGEEGQGGQGTLIGDCDNTIVPKAHCCYLADVDGRPALCTCSAELCSGSTKERESCSDLANYL
jgi:hypothetical protein